MLKISKTFTSKMEGPNCMFSLNPQHKILEYRWTDIKYQEDFIMTKNHHNTNNLQVAQVMNFVLLTGSTKNQTFYPRMLKSLSQL